MKLEVVGELALAPPAATLRRAGPVPHLGNTIEPTPMAGVREPDMKL